MSDGQKPLIERMLEAALTEGTRELRAERDELEAVVREDNRAGKLLNRLAAARATICELVAEMERTYETLAEIGRSRLPDHAERLLNETRYRLFVAVRTAKEQK
jgi:hypothetical protein